MNLSADDGHPVHGDGGMVGLSRVTDLYHEHELFELIDNQRVLELSSLREGGFRNLAAVRKSTGISVRRILRSGLTSVDLASRLWERLTQECDAGADSFDEIVLCHSHANPAECRTVARSLAERHPALRGRIHTVNYGCCGYLKLLDHAVQFLDGHPEAGRVALLSVETPETWHDGSDRLFCGIVSAGATASVVERGHGLPITIARSEDFRIPMDRRPNPNPLFVRDTCDAFCFRGSPVQRTVMRMNAESVFVNGIEMMLDNLRSGLTSINRQPGQRVIVVPHQPSGKLLKALIAAALSEFRDLEFVNNLDGYGNTISSSVPTIISRLPDVLRNNQLAPLNDGDHLILVAAGICMKEIDDHMSSGHSCLTWQAGALNAPRSFRSEAALAAAGNR